MKRSLLLTLYILLLTTSAYANKFVVVGCKHDSMNIDARRYHKMDVNGEYCGLILINTSISNLGVQANTGVATAVNYKKGYYWVYLSPGTQRITFYKEGFETLNYVLKKPVKSEETYILTLRSRSTSDVQTSNNMGYVVIKSQPSGADVYINDSATGMQTTFLNSYPEGYYSFKLKKPSYFDTTGTFEINPGNTTPVNIKLVANFGSLTISTKPEISADIIIDGNDKGTTPKTIGKLPPGSHTLQLNKEMYVPWQGNFVITRGKDTQRTITMRANFDTVTINAREGDLIYIDNLQKGTGSYTGRLLRGRHVIMVGHQHYYSQSRQVEVLPGKNLIETFNLQPKTGRLSVMTIPIGANIFVNNKFMGQTPKFIDSLKVGTYTVRLQKQGYATDEKHVVITENQVTTLKETLASGINVQITSQPPGAELYVDGRYEGITPQNIRLGLGSHLFKVQKDGYLPYIKSVPVGQDQNTKLNITLNVALNHELVKMKRRRNFWLISTFLTAGAGAYSYLQSNKLYSQYQTVTNNASALHSQINTLDQATPIVLGTAGFCFIEYIIHAAKCGKLKRKIRLTPIYSNNGGTLSLTYNF